MKQLKFELQISEFWIKVGQIKRIYFKNLSFFMEVDIESEKILKTWTTVKLLKRKILTDYAFFDLLENLYPERDFNLKRILD